MVNRILKTAAVIVIIAMTFLGTVMYTMSHMAIYVQDDTARIVIFGNVWEHGLAD